MKAENSYDTILLDISLSKYALPALAVADTIGLFKSVLNNHGNIESIAQNLKIKQQGIEAMVYFLVSKGFLELKNNIVRLTSVATNYLLPDSDYYWGGAFTFSKVRNSDEYKQILISMTINSAQLEIEGKNVSKMWESGKLDTEAALIFINGMQSLNHQASTLAIKSGVFANINHLLDVGGGSGCFVKDFTNMYPNARATIYELPEVCRLIKENIVNNRINLYSGNFFNNEFPSGPDGMLFANILHDWSYDKVHILLEKTYKSLPVGGKIFIHEVLLDEDKCGPEFATAFNLLMYINHGSQQYTKSELFNFLKQYGFHSLQAIKTHPYYFVVVGIK
jgi:hypothetical protein